MFRILKTPADHEAALVRVAALMQQELAPDSDAEAELELLSVLVEHYEQQHHPIGPPHPIAAIRFRMEQLGLPLSELNTLLGFRSRKSDILSGKRKLSLNMIRQLHYTLHIPAETLIAEYVPEYELTKRKD
jgi:HTH-type transcriptional regulator/antitoxin HigA